MATKKSKDTSVNTYKKQDVYNEAVDQSTGEVRKGQPGGSEGQAVSDRPTMTEEEARRINGYNGFENVEEQRKADPNNPSESEGYSTLAEKK